MMKSLLVCLLLLSLSGFRWERCAAARTIQVRVGENATLQCPLLAGSTSSPSTLSWYRKVAGLSPQLLLSFRTTNTSNVTFGSGVRSEKLSVSSNGSLLLRGSEQSDSAVYYCGISLGQEKEKKKLA
ncbi:secreted immunoglobulin domain 1 [Thunnus thynnus]|uniref:secreted immunoglobulin domain 1 n=1 Tax=Thunnus thynnus TaxID=8237 RepID=UPI003528CC49